MAAVAPLTSGDKKIKEIVDTVNELLKTPWLEGSSGVAESLTARVKEAFAQSARLLPRSLDAYGAHPARAALLPAPHRARGSPGCGPS